MRRTTMIHPFLCGAFPVLSVLSTNIRQVPVSARVLEAGIAAALLAGACAVALRAGIRDRHKAALIASAWALALFFRVLDAEWLLGQPSAAAEGAGSPLALWILAPAAATALVMRMRGDLEQWTRVANATALFMVAFPLLHIARYEVQRSQRHPVVAAQPARVTRAALPASSACPDIYYIILDRYASASTLAEIFHFDNRDFLDNLRAKGFYVAEESHSNYLKTTLSLATSLNMEYLDDLAGTMGANCDDLVPVNAKLRDHKVGRFLQARGYRYIHIGPLFEPTLENPHADENYNASPSNLIGTPFLARCLRDPSLPPDTGSWWSELQGIRHWLSAKYQFEKLAEISKRPERKFVFAHILVPHSPYVFDRNGRYLPPDPFQNRPDSERYIEQLRFANTQVKLLVDQILANATHPPVILLQADEGPFPERYCMNQEGFDWHTATTSELRMKTGILNAYLIPEGLGKTGLHPSITPVNSFRVVFNTLFGTRLPLLPDRVYAFRDGRHVYDFFDVSSRVRTRRAGEEAVAAGAVAPAERLVSRLRETVRRAPRTRPAPSLARRTRPRRRV